MLDLAPIKKHLKDIQSAKGWKAILPAIPGDLWRHSHIELKPADGNLSLETGFDRLAAWSEIAADAQHLLDENEKLRQEKAGLVRALNIIATGQDDDLEYADDDEDGEDFGMTLIEPEEIALKALELFASN